MCHPVQQDTGSDLSLGRGKERRKGIIGDFRWITSSEENIACAASSSPEIPMKAAFLDL